MLIVFDIETVKNGRADEYYELKEYQHDRRLKDEAKIKADIEKKREADKAKAGLSWWTGRVASIAWAGWDKPERVFKFANVDEQAIIEIFFNEIQSKFGTPRLLGKNSYTFDEPFLVGRCIALNIGVPPFLKQSGLSDVDSFFGKGSMCSQKTKLENYAWGMGIDGKTNKGSEVQAMWDADKLKEISDYNAEDVRITMELAKRYYKDFKFYETDEERISYADQL